MWSLNLSEVSGICGAYPVGSPESTGKNDNESFSAIIKIPRIFLEGSWVCLKCKPPHRKKRAPLRVGGCAYLCPHSTRSTTPGALGGWRVSSSNEARLTKAAISFLWLWMSRAKSRALAAC